MRPILQLRLDPSPPISRAAVHPSRHENFMNISYSWHMAVFSNPDLILRLNKGAAHTLSMCVLPRPAVCRE